ncbi:hypothetical protein [uncultured Microscilla sp.]|nr:hypothetical protein [uncultured Microscilla sp.]
MKMIEEKDDTYSARIKNLSTSIERKVALRRNFMKEIEKRLNDEK